MYVVETLTTLGVLDNHGKIVGTASGLSRRFCFRLSFSAMLSKQSLGKWSLQTSEYPLGSFQSTLVFFHFAYPLIMYTSIAWELVKTDTIFRGIATACYDTTSSHASTTNTGIHVPASMSSISSAPNRKYFLRWLLFDTCSSFASVFLGSGYRIIVN